MAFRAVAPPKPAQGLQTPPRQAAAVVKSAASATATAISAVAASKTTPRNGTPTGVTDSPGNWRHPRLDEITKRRAASVFSETNLRTIVYNGLALGVVFVARTATGAPFKQLAKIAHDLVPAQYSNLLALAVQAVLAINIIRALLPLFRQPDNLSDIPLTPGQRKLLGLPALKAPATPNAVYSTPPRYTRTPSVSGSPASTTMATKDTSFNSSPISNSPLFPKTRSGNGGSPYSPGSPFQNTRRSSFGSPSSLGGTNGGIGGNGGASLFSESTLSSLPGTPSPTSGKRLSMGLNNKWLYEKGRRSSGGARIY